MSINRVKPGQKVEVLIYSGALRKSIWTSGYTVQAVLSAADRSHRIDVTGPRAYRDCAPEYVRAAIAKAVQS